MAYGHFIHLNSTPPISMLATDCGRVAMTSTESWCMAFNSFGLKAAHFNSSVLRSLFIITDRQRTVPITGTCVFKCPALASSLKRRGGACEGVATVQWPETGTATTGTVTVSLDTVQNHADDQHCQGHASRRKPLSPPSIDSRRHAWLNAHRGVGACCQTQ